MSSQKTLPPTFFVGAAAFSVAVHFTFPGVIMVRYPINLWGGVPMIFGAVLNLWADQVFKRANTTVKPFEKPSALIVKGPFRVFRHPMYFGMLMLLAGISIICGSIMSFVGPIIFWVMIRMRFIPIEERSLLDVFGDEYREYRRRVHAWM